MKAKLVEELTKQTYPLPDKETVTIGSGQSNDIVIPQHSVALQHAEITYFKGKHDFKGHYAIWNVSYIGTSVNGKDIRGTDLTELKDGDKILFGKYYQMKFILEN